MQSSQTNPPIRDQNRMASLLLRARLGRREFRRFAIKLRYGSQSLEGAPILFANSFPKSGTHLLTQVLKGFSYLGPAVYSGLPAIVTYQGDTGRQRSENEISHDFNRLQPGDIAYGHIHATPLAINILCDEGFAAYFILRDPRDVAVSHVHYITDMAPQHIHHSYYRELRNFNERLQTSILGFNRKELEKESHDTLSMPNIRDRFEPYLEWLDRSEVLCLRFEDFVNDRQSTVTRVFDHAVRRGFTAKIERDGAINILAQSIAPERSPTYRSGKVGGWRTAFTEEHKANFKEISGDLLIRLGYEENNDW